MSVILFELLLLIEQRDDSFLWGEQLAQMLPNSDTDSVVFKALAEKVAASGASVTFLTGLALLNSQTGQCQVDCVPFTVHMRQLDQARIERYLRLEQPYDCAGSFKAEGLGVSLFQSTEGPDATSLIGLPLIALCDMLRQAGMNPLGDA